MVCLHSYFNLYALPAVDGGLETGAIDNRLRERDTIVDGDLYFLGGLVHHCIMQLLGDVERVVPLAVVGQDGVDGQQMVVEETIGVMRTVSEDTNLRLQRAVTHYAYRESLCGRGIT